jgi:NAD(P)-dependent dehydrogenase (short-subunit alcohol dehydrogenase family)
MLAASILKGKTAFVTGGAGGLGRAIAHTLQSAGADGMILDLDAAAAMRGAPAGWQGLAGDVCEESSLHEAMRHTVHEFGGIDIVVANAGVVPPWKETEHISLDEWDRTFAINVRGVVATIKAAVPHLKVRGGSIIALGSEASYNGHPRQSTYVASKHAVLGIVRSTALDLGRYNIRVNAVGPGAIATEALLRRVALRAAAACEDPSEVLQKFVDGTALGRMATEADVANAVLFLASDLSSSITGSIIPIDAGAR